MEQNPDVAYVEPDTIVTIQDIQPNATWGLDRIDQRDRPLNGAYEYGVNGSGVHAYIIDTGILGSGQAIRFLIPVNRGVDYVFLAGTDSFALDADIYVYDEVGQLILDDRRGSKLAGVQFRSSYNGTAVVYLHMARANGLASYCVLVGRRGVQKEGISGAGGEGDAAVPQFPEKK